MVSARTLLLLTALAAAPRVEARAQEPFPQGDDERAPQLFSLNASREAEGLARRALAALAAKRPKTAFAAFDDLLADHGAEVLPPDLGADGASQFTYHQGVEPWVRARLLELDDADRTEWDAWCEGRAGTDLARAVAAGDGEALVELARRRPLSPIAARAWLAVSDLDRAGGRVDEALRSLERAAEFRSTDTEFARAFGRALTARTEALSFATAPSLEEVDARRIPRGPVQGFEFALPDGPFSRNFPSVAAWALQGVVEGERLYVDTSLQLLCIDLLAGEEIWRSDEPAGWSQLDRNERSDFYEAIDHLDAYVVPAISQGVAVASHQIPLSSHGSYVYQGIKVTSRIPERRLFAYDAASGEPLWDHAPGSGVCPLAENFAVAGPPLVADGRVYVPCARVEGRIELRVLCIDLFDGTLVWSSRVVSGQRALNMFNRHEQEFWAAPLVLAGDDLVVCSQLGSVASLDARTGSCNWQAVYEPIPLPRTRGLWRNDDRNRYWRNSAPVVVDGKVFATPTDCEDLLVVDLASGRVLWSQSEGRLRDRYERAGETIDLMIGAADGDVFLCDTRIAAISSEGEYFFDRQLVRLPDFVLDPRDRTPGPRAVLTSDRILVPTAVGLVVFDHQGRLLEDEGIDWHGGEQGNLAFGAGALVTVRGDSVHGFLDIEVLEQRTLERLRRDPGDVVAIETYARLLARRADVAAQSGDLELALEQHARLREITEPVLGRDVSLRSLHTASVRLEAERMAGLGRTEDAARLLRDAAREAWTADDALALLLALGEIERPRGDDAWLAVLDAIESRAPNAEVGPGTLAVDIDWCRWVDPREPRTGVPAGTWVAVQRAFVAERRDGPAAAVAAWQAALEDHGDVAIDGRPAREPITHSISTNLLEAPDAYAPFEALARKAFDEARESRDTDAIDVIVRRYPFSEVAREALDVAVDWALERGDLADAVDRTRRAVAAGAATNLERMCGLALLADAAGNGSLARGLLDEIARRDPRWTASRDSLRGLTAEQIVPALRSPSEPVPPPASFDETVKLDRMLEGPLDLLGLAPSTAPEAVDPEYVLVRRGQLERIGVSGDLTSRTTPFSAASGVPSDNRRALSPEAIVFLNAARLSAFDPNDGRLRWEWPERRPRPRGASISTSSTVSRSARVSRSPSWTRPRVRSSPSRSSSSPGACCGRSRCRTTRAGSPRSSPRVERCSSRRRWTRPRASSRSTSSPAARGSSSRSSRGSTSSTATASACGAGASSCPTSAVPSSTRTTCGPAPTPTTASSEPTTGDPASSRSSRTEVRSTRWSASRASTSAAPRGCSRSSPASAASARSRRSTPTNSPRASGAGRGRSSTPRTCSRSGRSAGARVRPAKRSSARSPCRSADRGRRRSASTAGSSTRAARCPRCRRTSSRSCGVRRTPRTRGAGASPSTSTSWTSTRESRSGVACSSTTSNPSTRSACTATATRCGSCA
ncbi:MAG: PQQ-binding-like beta-propeller repeat protein [Planctomycetota bacterium]